MIEIMIIPLQTLRGGYSLDSSLRDDSNEYPQHMVFRKIDGSRMLFTPPPQLDLWHYEKTAYYL